MLRSLNSGTERLTDEVRCGGEHVFSLEKGLYLVEAARGKLYEPYSGRVEIAGDGGAGPRELEIVLKEIIDPRSLGLYSFDAHSHVSRDDTLKTGDLLTASTVMRSEGFDFFFAGSPYDNESHMEYINRNFTRPEPYRERFAAELRRAGGGGFVPDIGNEMIKCRYGHVFLMNFEQRPPFSRYFDHAFDPWLFDKQGDEPPYEIDYIHEALRREKGENSVAVFAHPTSWWWHDNGEFITNIAATLGFELLAGSVDAMVVMGYQNDKKYYQELWFDALRNGYFLPGTAETDAAFDTVPGHLEHKTYTKAEAFDIGALCRAVKAGRNMVSSGPLLTLTANGGQPGDVLPFARGEPVLLGISAYACCQAPISKVQIIMNGEIHREYRVRENRFSVEEAVRFPEEGFVIAKCFDFAGNVAMTNPVYIRNGPFANRGYTANVNISVTKDGRPANGFYRAGGGDRLPFGKEICLRVNPAEDIHVEVGGEVKTARLFELPELQGIFRNLYFGGFNADMRWLPGEVPAEAFRLKRIKEILDSAEMAVEF
ncbi:MAG: CehA/McbA family metallohydrolase [Firmicutes bacterium]|nr:CehA/McbA family metallohydrolase [Bacillota bacterium]